MQFTSRAAARPPPPFRSRALQFNRRVLEGCPSLKVPYAPRPFFTNRVRHHVQGYKTGRNSDAAPCHSASPPGPTHAAGTMGPHLRTASGSRLWLSAAAARNITPGAALCQAECRTYGCTIVSDLWHPSRPFAPLWC